ncbi:MAG: hypothetical protein H6741_00815 [Alphaproteobacteria bacterium]|nr:hypothetical protein [Alphaproteobacteria bacterium]MCB9791243.1 hypothetical protein [Alphaproteobacteria bacterium]
MWLWLILACTPSDGDAPRIDLRPVLEPGALRVEVTETHQVAERRDEVQRVYLWEVQEGGRVGQDPLALKVTLEQVRLREWKGGERVRELSGADASGERAQALRPQHLALVAPEGLSWTVALAPKVRPRVDVDRSPLDAKLAAAGVDAIRARSTRLAWEPEALIERLRAQLLELPGGRRALGEVWQSPPAPGQVPLGPFGDPAGISWTLDAVSEEGVARLSGDYALPEVSELLDARCRFTLLQALDGPPRRFEARCDSLLAEGRVEVHDSLEIAYEAP